MMELFQPGGAPHRQSLVGGSKAKAAIQRALRSSNRRATIGGGRMKIFNEEPTDHRKLKEDELSHLRDSTHQRQDLIPFSHNRPFVVLEVGQKGEDAPISQEVAVCRQILRQLKTSDAYNEFVAKTGRSVADELEEIVHAVVAEDEVDLIELWRKIEGAGFTVQGGVLSKLGAPYVPLGEVDVSIAKSDVLGNKEKMDDSDDSKHAQKYLANEHSRRIRMQTRKVHNLRKEAKEFRLLDEITDSNERAKQCKSGMRLSEAFHLGQAHQRRKSMASEAQREQFGKTMRKEALETLVSPRILESKLPAIRQSQSTINELGRFVKERQERILEHELKWQGTMKEQTYDNIGPNARVEAGTKFARLLNHKTKNEWYKEILAEMSKSEEQRRKEAEEEAKKVRERYLEAKRNNDSELADILKGGMEKKGRVLASVQIQKKNRLQAASRAKKPSPRS